MYLTLLLTCIVVVVVYLVRIYKIGKLRDSWTENHFLVNTEITETAMNSSHIKYDNHIRTIIGFPNETYLLNL